MGVIIELQQDALDQDVKVSFLLRKALVVTKKLKLNNPESWILSELKGYEGQPLETIPDFRKMEGQVKSLHPIYGWQPVIFQGSGKLAASLSECAVQQSIGEIESLFAGERTQKPTLMMPFSASESSYIAKLMEDARPVTRFVNPVQVLGILEAVRNAVLDWSLRLEEDGIVGQHLSFSVEERTIATSSQPNIVNIYGPVSSTQIQQGTIGSSQDMSLDGEEIDKLRTFLKSMELEIEELKLKPNELGIARADILTAKVQIDSPQPNLSIMKECLSSLRNILENAAATSLVQALVSAVPSILG